MLTIEPARRTRGGRTRIAVALAGGGVLGSFYEIGALHALSEAIEGLDLVHADVFAGVSSGALVAAGLANGFDTAQMGALYIDGDVTEFALSPAKLFQPAICEYLSRLAQLPAVLGKSGRQYLREPLSGLWSAAIAQMGRMVPTAVFDNGPLEEYLRSTFSSPGHTDDFRKLKSHLYVVATNLNTAETVHFGARGLDHVPISRAVLASAALPGLYPAVEIEGQQYVDGALVRTMNASLALEEGCNLVICVNPLVPFDASRSHRNLAEDGLPVVLGQMFRSLIHSRMKVGWASYQTRFPAADTILLEPDRDDELFFFTNVFRYSGRKRLAEHAYQCTRRDLLSQADVLAPLLARRGLRLDLKALRDRKRTFSSASTARAVRGKRSAEELGKALSRLESAVAKRSGAAGRRKARPRARPRAVRSRA